MITTSVRYAAMLVNEANKRELFKLKDFCEKQKISLHYMEQMGRKLVSADILGSKRGPGGGYYVKKDRVSVYDVIACISDAKKHESESALGRAVSKALDTIVIVKKTNAQNEQNQ